MRITPIHFDLGENVELYVVLYYEFLNVWLLSWFLAAELVAWECEYEESVVPVLEMDGSQLCVVEGLQSSLGGYIHH